MKNLYQNILTRMNSPSALDIAIALIVTMIAGTVTGEIVSRPINSYIQASCMLGSLFLSIVTIRMIFIRIMNYIHENQ